MPYTVPKLKDFSARALDKASEKLLAALATESKAVKNADDLKTFRDRWMARKDGVLTEINDLWLKTAPKEAKREVGQRVNELKSKVTQAVEECQPGTAKAAASVDATVGVSPSTSPSPAFSRPIGAEHPVIKTMNEIVVGLPQSRLLRRRRPGD